jgi:hypothetical protein
VTAFLRRDCSPDRARARSASSGQASVELIGGLSALLLAALVGFQLLTAGYAAVMADHAAEAAALALANGEEPAKAARAALPGWPPRSLRVQTGRNRVAVELTAPSPLGFLKRRLVLTGEAAVREPRRPGG